MRKFLGVLIGLTIFTVMSLVLVYNTHGQPASRGEMTPSGLLNLPFIILFFGIGIWVYGLINPTEEVIDEDTDKPGKDWIKAKEDLKKSRKDW